MSGSARVLVFSRDQMLLHTRQLILGAFFQVDGAGRIQEVEKLLHSRNFDLVVLCYTLTDSERALLFETLDGQNPQPKVLSLIAAHSNVFPAPTDLLQMREAGPYYLLKRSAEILGIELKSKGRFIAA
jgi:DNA-binding response OmpR family regulator